MPTAAARQRLPKFSRPQCSAGPTNAKRKDNRRWLCLDLAKKTFHLSGSFLLTQEQKNNDVNYHHHYSPTPSGVQATKGRTCDTSKSEVGRMRIQRASTWSSVKAALWLDLCWPSSASSSRKCDKVATNADWAPQQIPLATAASTRPSSSCAPVERDAAREDGPPAQSSTKS
jgi:hypothetical protein